MKSVAVTIIIFIGLYIIVSSDVLSFFAQKSFTWLALGAVALMLMIAVAVLGLPRIKLGRKNNEEK